MKKKLYQLLYLLFICSVSFSVEMIVADFGMFSQSEDVVMDENPADITRLLIEKIYGYIEKDEFNVTPLHSYEFVSDVAMNAVVTSRAEAEELGFYLENIISLYGRLEKSADEYRIIAFLYDNETNVILQSFEQRESARQLENLLDRLALEVIAYLKIEYIPIYVPKEKAEEAVVVEQTVTDEPEEAEETIIEEEISDESVTVEHVSYTPNEPGKSTKKVNHLEVYGAAGYFVPMGQYWGLMTGAINVEAGLRFDFVPYLLNRDKIKVLFKPGFLVSYSFAVHKPEVSDFYCNMLIFKFPAEFGFLIAEKHTILAGTGAGLSVDIYSIKESDGGYSPYAEPRFAFFVNAGYEYFFGQKRAIGIGCNNIVNFTVSKSFYAEYKLQCYVAYKISFKNKKSPSRLLVEKDD